MPVLYKPSDPDLYEFIKDRNLSGQLHLLQTLVDFSIKKKVFTFTPDIVLALHHSVSLFLDESPGQIRTRDVHIQASDHVPPDHHEVTDYFYKYTGFIQKNIDTMPITELSAYALWRLAWIHPFNECNGRTARAVAYFIVCYRQRRWLSGGTTIHELIRMNETVYYEGLEAADKTYHETGKYDVSVLEGLLRKALYVQLMSE